MLSLTNISCSFHRTKWKNISPLRIMKVQLLFVSFVYGGSALQVTTSGNLITTESSRTRCFKIAAFSVHHAFYLLNIFLLVLEYISDGNQMLTTGYSRIFLSLFIGGGGLVYGNNFRRNEDSLAMVLNHILSIYRQIEFGMVIFSKK